MELKTPDNIKIRAANADDALIGTQLIYLPMGELGDFLFGLGEPGMAQEVLGKLFAEACNLFSHQFAYIAIKSDQVVGLLLAYPGPLIRNLALTMAKQLLNIYGVPRMGRFIWNAVPLSRIREPAPDEYFINTLAVLPDYQGQGIGTQLLAYAEYQAKSEGMRKCALDVDIENDGACRLYSRLGYSIVNSVRSKRLIRRIGHQGLYRMVKILA
ncbi:MAG: GNAT family N-acetyltransferase [Candidatus Neomarinimicrobiota bacterium]